MKIFIGNIPEETECLDLISFIESVMDTQDFIMREFIGDVNIIQLEDPVTGVLEFHGLITLEPDALARELLEKLPEQPLLGITVSAREYTLRNQSNDPRSREAKSSKKNDLRKGERRRQNMEVELKQESSDSYPG